MAENSGLYSSMIQRINISKDISREQIYELGRRGPYFKYVNFPIEVSCEIKIEDAQKMRHDLIERICNDKYEEARQNMLNKLFDIQKLPENPCVEFPLNVFNFPEDDNTKESIYLNEGKRWPAERKCTCSSKDLFNFGCKCGGV
jgi:hypothetical protein